MARPRSSDPRRFERGLRAARVPTLRVDGDTLLAQPFDVERLEIKGQPFLVGEHVGRNTGYMSAVSASRTGAIAYANTLPHAGRLLWFDRAGRPLETTHMPDGDYVDFRLSPDDARLAASLANSKTNVVEVWLFDWSLDGHIVFSGPSRAAGNDLWLLPLGEEGKVSKFLGSPAEELHGNFSPDGRLLAYTSNESGKFEVYVETIPPSDRKWFVSTSGGYEPRWRADGREIFFLSEDRRLLSVAVGAGPSFGVPKVPVSDACGRKGHRAPAPSIRVVLNWTAALKK